MRLGKAITLAAVIGVVGIVATSMVHAGGNCGSKGSCSSMSKASMQGGGSCPGKATMQRTGASCSDKASMSKAGGQCAGQASAMCKSGASCPAMGKASGSGSGCCASAKGASMQCSMAPADCEKMMRTYYKSHGWLGIEMDSADGVTMPVVTTITAGSPAEQAGFKVGDVLTSINGVGFDAKNAEVLQGIMDKGFQAGQTVTYTAKRDSQIVTLRPVLAQIPDASLSQMIASHLANAHKPQEKTS